MNAGILLSVMGLVVALEPGFPIEEATVEKDEAGVVLQKWCDATERLGPYEATLKRIIYDNVKKTQTHERVHVWAEAPDRWRMNREPLKIAYEQLRTGYNIGKSDPDTIIRVGDQFFFNGQLLRIDEKNRPGFMTLSWFLKKSCSSPLYWLAFPHRYRTTLERLLVKIEPHSSKERENQTYLIVWPTAESDSRSFRTVNLLIDQETSRLVAAKIHDPSGTSEDLYLVERVEGRARFDEGVFDIPVRESESDQELPH